jgi:hypothetical protein
MEHRRSSIACTTAAVPPTAGQLVTSERGVCGGPLAFHYANLMSHTAFRQSLACVSLLYQGMAGWGTLSLDLADIQYNHLAKLPEPSLPWLLVFTIFALHAHTHTPAACQIISL